MYLCRVKKFEIPAFYRSPVISRIKGLQAAADPLRQSLAPFLLDLETVRFLIPRHFGFCYGVENAIEIAFRAIHENPGKRIFLISQMIHNPAVNADLQSRGVGFLQDTEGRTLFPLNELSKEDVVITPAFGTTLRMMEELRMHGVEIKKYDTTCPFVERVWNKSSKLADGGYTVIVHGKVNHEETKATFSRTSLDTPSIVVLNRSEAGILCDHIGGRVTGAEVKKAFLGKMSDGFDPDLHLERVGVVNQTTMLASETEEIAAMFRDAMIQRYGEANLKSHFADTRDTLCYATNQNQDAAISIASGGADLAMVVGGYNSSNTSHLVEILEKKLPVYFVDGPDRIRTDGTIEHFDIHSGSGSLSELRAPKNPSIILSSGASCPDSIVDAVLRKISSLFPGAKEPSSVLDELLQN